MSSHHRRSQSPSSHSNNAPTRYHDTVRHGGVRVSPGASFSTSLPSTVVAASAAASGSGAAMMSPQLNNSLSSSSTQQQQRQQEQGPSLQNIHDEIHGLRRIARRARCGPRVAAAAAPSSAANPSTAGPTAGSGSASLSQGTATLSSRASLGAVMVCSREASGNSAAHIPVVTVDPDILSRAPHLSPPRGVSPTHGPARRQSSELHLGDMSLQSPQLSAGGGGAALPAASSSGIAGEAPLISLMTAGDICGNPNANSSGITISMGGSGTSSGYGASATDNVFLGSPSAGACGFNSSGYRANMQLGGSGTDSGEGSTTSSPASCTTPQQSSRINTEGFGASSAAAGINRGTPSAYVFYQHQQMARAASASTTTSPAALSGSSGANSITSAPGSSSASMPRFRRGSDQSVLSGGGNSCTSGGRARGSLSQDVRRGSDPQSAAGSSGGSRRQSSPSLATTPNAEQQQQQHQHHLSPPKMPSPSNAGSKNSSNTVGGSTALPPPLQDPSLVRRLPGGWIADKSVAPFLNNLNNDAVMALSGSSGASSSSGSPGCSRGSGSVTGRTTKNKNSNNNGENDDGGDDDDDDTQSPILPRALLPKRGTAVWSEKRSPQNTNNNNSPSNTLDSPNIYGQSVTGMPSCASIFGQSTTQHVADGASWVPGQNYQVVRTLGKGSFSRVYLVRDSRTEEYCVDKVMKWDAAAEKREEEEAARKAKQQQREQQQYHSRARGGGSPGHTPGELQSVFSVPTSAAPSSSSSSSPSASSSPPVAKPVPVPDAQPPPDCKQRPKTAAEEKAIASRKALARKDVELLANCAHPNIVQFVGCFETATATHLIIEFLDGGDLAKELDRRKLLARPLRLEVALRYFVQLCLSVDYLHQNNIIHRDLKPQNLLLGRGSEGYLKLSDFGFAARQHQEQGQQFGTPFYASPEMWRPVDHGPASDVWSVGVILYEMLSLRLPFSKNSTSAHAVTSEDTCRVPALPDSVPRELRELAYSALRFRPSNRPTVRQMLQRSRMVGAALLQLLESAWRSRSMHPSMKEILRAHISSILGKEVVENALQQQQQEGGGAAVAQQQQQQQQQQPQQQ